MLGTDRPGADPINSHPAAIACPDSPSGGEPLGSSPFSPRRPEFERSLRSLRFALWGAALLLGAFDAWFPRFSMSFIGHYLDGVSYIDLAAAYARGDWAHALNGYWSPLYSWLIALAFRVLHPSAYAEFPVVHLVNLIIFVGALASFDYLWRGWMEDHCARIHPLRGYPAAGRTGWISLPPWALLVVGFFLFTWTSIGWISVQGMSPDLLVAALVYLAAGVTLRLRRGEARPRAAALLGAVLGFGFLAKAVMLPLALVFLLVAFMPARNPRRAALSLLSAGIAFLIVTAPFLYGLSRQKGHLTLGDTGRLNYAWFVNGVPQFHWRGETPGHGKPLHPTRLIYPKPPVYEFAGPVGGTYPIWTDPSYWYEGVKARFNWRQQAHVVLKNLTVGRRQLPGTGPGGLVVAVLMLLLTIVLAVKRRLPSLVRWDLLLISLAPAVLYSLVVIESRYLGAYVVLFGLALLPAVRLPANEKGKAMVVPATLLILLVPAVSLAQVGTRDIGRRSASRTDWEAATGLWAMGIHAGDRVGCVGLSGDDAWARLARVSVVAEIPLGREREYWRASPRVQSAVLRAFSKAGVRAVVTGRPPTTRAARGWHHLGTTDIYVRLLHPPRHNRASHSSYPKAAASS